MIRADGIKEAETASVWCLPARPERARGIPSQYPENPGWGIEPAWPRAALPSWDALELHPSIATCGQLFVQSSVQCEGEHFLTGRKHFQSKS